MPELDAREAWQVIRQLIGNEVSVETAMKDLIDHCQKCAPASIWKKVASLDYRGDWKNLKKWLTTVLANEPPPPSIKAFWFGLFLPVDDCGRVSLGLYVCGSKTFDRKDETFDWASSPAYFPEGRYAQSAVLKAIYKHSQKASALSSALQEIIGVGFVAISVAQICREEPKAIFGTAKKRHIAAGFDSGDGFLVGAVTAEGFQPAVHREVNHLKPLKPTRSKAEYYLFKVPMPWHWWVGILERHGSQLGDFATRGKVERVVEGWETQARADERRPPVDVIYDLFDRPMVRERIAKIMKELSPDTIQLIPVRIGGLPSKAGTYYILNVSRRIACLDREASRLFCPDGELSWIAKGVLQRSRIGRAHVFRLDEYENWIVISRVVKEMLESEHVTGVKLVPLETID